MSQLRFSVIENGAVTKIRDNLDGTTVCYLPPERLPDKTRGMAQVMCNALNEVETRRPPQQNRLV